MSESDKLLEKGGTTDMANAAYGPCIPFNDDERPLIVLPERPERDPLKRKKRRAEAKAKADNSFFKITKK